MIMFLNGLFLLFFMEFGLIRESTSRFVKLRCPKCKNEQNVFGKTSTKIKCLVCEKVLALPTGGKSKIKAQILEVLE